MSTTEDTAHEDAASQSSRRRVDIVPHTHWDRECSGAVSSRSNAAETWSAGTHTNGVCHRVGTRVPALRTH